MTECVKDFTKVLIKVDPLTDTETENAGMKTLYDRIVKNGNLEVCIRKCANNTPPMGLYDQSSKMHIEDAIKLIDTGFGCKGIPSSETIDNKVTYKCAFGVYNSSDKRCEYTPANYFPGVGI